VYLAEYTLQHVGLSAWLGFSTAHMAIIFQNPKIRKWYVMDQFAKSAETIANLIMPSISPDSPWNQMNMVQKIFAYLQGQVVDFLAWDNLGYVRMREDKASGEFQDMQHIGSTTGGEVRRVRDWVINDLTRQDEGNLFTFDMWQIYNGSTNVRIRKSKMCHDFIEDVLQMIKFTDDEDISVFRDSLNLNVTSWEIVDMTNKKIRRDYQRFLRFFRNHVYESTRDLRHSEVTLTKFHLLKLPFILFLDGDKYAKMTLSGYSILNYCRMPMHFEKGKPYVPAKLDDPHQQCFLKSVHAHDNLPRVRFTLSDYAIWIEQMIDDALFGVDGKGVDPLSHARIVFETTVILIAITKLSRWFTNKP
jgi:hypothetical protein